MADADISECVDHIALKLHNPTAALNLLDEIDKKYGLLEDNPLMGTEYVTERGRLYRYVLVKRYMMFYTVSDNVVKICRFLYAPSNFGERLDWEMR
jgi:plasmid stabilization system protein ParE